MDADCMKPIKLSKGCKAVPAGRPDRSVIQIPDPETVGVSAMDIPYIRPRLLVKENDPIRTGEPLFFDKRNKRVQYVSPGTGIIQKIIFGERRKLVEIVIRLTGKDDFIRFDPLNPADLERIDKPSLIRRLQEGGLWPCFREFPFQDTADPDLEPPMIIVSLNGGDLFSPEPDIVLKNQALAFEFGLEVLKRMTGRVIVTARQTSLKHMNGLAGRITHVTPDAYPAWDPGVVLFHLKTTPAENRSWCISGEHLAMIGQFLVTGVYPVQRVYTVTREEDQKPHILARQGLPVSLLVDRVPEHSLITTGCFNGRTVSPDAHMGFFDTGLNVLPDRGRAEFLGFIRPGLSKPTVSNTFLSSLIQKPMARDCNLHGEERACINCGYCARICPVDLAPCFILKALIADDMEEALGLGLLDCCRCGLCAYACPSKIELTDIFSNGILTHYKDKE